jgi:hypothetical protein
MKYFTPELVVAYGSDDPATWKNAEARWDDACARYNAYLASVKDRLPADLRHIEDTYRLHDAVVRVMGRRGREFVLLLQPTSPPQPLLTFIYELVGEPVIRKDVLPLHYQSTGGYVDWQYDEIEMAEGLPPTWRQAILLSNGWEVVLHFRNVRVEEAEALLPAPRNGAVTPRQEVAQTV